MPGARERYIDAKAALPQLQDDHQYIQNQINPHLIIEALRGISETFLLTQTALRRKRPDANGQTQTARRNWPDANDPYSAPGLFSGRYSNILVIYRPRVVFSKLQLPLFYEASLTLTDLPMHFHIFPQTPSFEFTPTATGFVLLFFVLILAICFILKKSIGKEAMRVKRRKRVLPINRFALFV
uniref:Uncharacterized protein n=1 Tax=Globodera rostochiensis TaxID=31243 RepID=A0A914GZW6_GLORO